MAQNLFSICHLAFMETALPVGVAIIDRAKKGHLDTIIDGLMSSDNSIEILKEEGAEGAQLVRMQLDQIIPGLGNPVVEVKVSVTPRPTNNEQNFSDSELAVILNRIESRIKELKIHVDASTLHND